MACGSGLTRGATSLTQRSIEALRPAETAYRVSDQRCIGLAVRVAPSGIKTWDLAYRIRSSGKTRRLSLGRVCDVTLEKARDRANELTSAARTGRDLIAEEEKRRAAAASRLTVEKLIELYVKRELFDQCADQGIEREAERRRQTVGAMFRWALSQDIVEMDPTAGLKAYDPGTPRDRTLTVNEIELLWKWLDSDALPQDPSDILKLELLTGARCGEISGLCAEEIGQEEWIWTLPAARSKNKRSRITPLVGLARQIVQARVSTVHSGPLFRAETGTTLTAAHVGHYLLARRGKLPIDKFTTHDLRRTVATMLVDMGLPLEVVAAVIGHEAGGKETRTLVRHYIRTDQIERKVQVLRAWDERLQAIVAGREQSKVVRLLKTG